MTVLSKLIRRRGFDGLATSTPATLATNDGGKLPTVAIVATVSVANQSEQKTVHMSIEDESLVRTWLERIDEDDAVCIELVLDRCRTDPEALNYFLWRAAANDKC